MLTDPTSHFTSHGKSGGCGRGDDTSGVFGIGSSVGLREFERGQIGSGLIPDRQPNVHVNQEMNSRVKGVGVLLEERPMSVEL